MLHLRMLLPDVISSTRLTKQLIPFLLLWWTKNSDFTAKRFTSNIYIVHSSHTNMFVGIAALTSLLNKKDTDLFSYILFYFWFQIRQVNKLDTVFFQFAYNLFFWLRCWKFWALGGIKTKQTLFLSFTCKNLFYFKQYCLTF